MYIFVSEATVVIRMLLKQDPSSKNKICMCDGFCGCNLLPSVIYLTITFMHFRHLFLFYIIQLLKSS